MKIQQYVKLPRTPPLPNTDQPAAETPGESSGSCTAGAKQTGEFKDNMKEIRPGTPDTDTATHAPTSMFTASCSVAFRFCFVFSVFSVYLPHVRNALPLCLNSCRACNYAKTTNEHMV